MYTRYMLTLRVLLAVLATLAVGLIFLGCGGGPATEEYVEPEPSPTAPAAAPPLLAYLEPGAYRTGLMPLYFHDPNRPFDGWNARHASDGYKATLAEVNAAGENQIVATHAWYPLQAADGSAQTPTAGGPFPVIIAAHGLGGSSQGWSTFAQYLASHGYVVVAASFITDSPQPRSFESPDSKYAQQAGDAGVDKVYGVIRNEFKVIPGFYKYFFGNVSAATFGGSQTQQGLRAAPDGPEKVGGMMAEFFTQRLDDVDTILDGLYSLNGSAESCAAEYLARGQPNHGAQVCGLFSGSLDLDRVGIMGHSLGSMTAQFAVARSGRITAAVGYNNGPPRLWEPKGVFGTGSAADGQPAGSPKPVMQIHGSEDAFVQGVFRGLMWNTFSAAGGNPEDLWPLEAERVLPTDENPQPVARNAYTRATGDKVIISVKDLDHDALTSGLTISDGNRGDPGQRPRKAVGQDVLLPSFQGENFAPLGWGTVEGREVYMPAFIRNYYTKNWFDFYLKGDEGGLRFIGNPIEDMGILDIRSSLQDR